MATKGNNWSHNHHRAQAVELQSVTRPIQASQFSCSNPKPHLPLTPAPTPAPTPTPTPSSTSSNSCCVEIAWSSHHTEKILCDTSHGLHQCAHQLVHHLHHHLNMAFMSGVMMLCYHDPIDGHSVVSVTSTVAILHAIARLTVFEVPLRFFMAKVETVSFSVDDLIAGHSSSSTEQSQPQCQLQPPSPSSLASTSTSVALSLPIPPPLATQVSRKRPLLMWEDPASNLGESFCSGYHNHFNIRANENDDAMNDEDMPITLGNDANKAHKAQQQQHQHLDHQSIGSHLDLARSIERNKFRRLDEAGRFV
jgi:hypothetical protein